MKAALSLVGLVSTIGVTGLCLKPIPNDDIFASFGSQYTALQMQRNVLSMDLEIISIDEQLKHVVVSNPKGDAPKRLRLAGAHFILKAKFANYCSNTPQSSPRSS